MKKINTFTICIFIFLLLSISGCSVLKTKNESVSRVNTSVKQKTDQAIMYSNKNKPTNKPTWDVVFERIYQNTEKYEIDVFIPKIIGNGLKQEVYEKINSVLKKYAEQQIEDIKKISAGSEGDSGLYPYTLYIKYEWDKSVEPYVSFLFEEYSYTGGAHGLTQIEGFTFDLRTGNSIKLVNYLNNDQQKLIKNYINFARALCNDLDDPPYGVFSAQDNQKAFDEDLFEDMVFKNNGLLICFEPYKIASYARGVVRFWFDLKELKNKEVNTEFDLSNYGIIKKLLSMNLSEIRKEFGLPVEIYSYEGGLLYKTKSGLLFSFDFNSVERLEDMTKAYVNSFSAGDNIKLFGISLKGSLSDLDKKLENIKELKKISEGIDEEWGSYFVLYELGEAIELYIESKTSDKNSDVSYILVKKKRF